MTLSRLKKLIFLHLQRLPMKSRAWRPFFVKQAGVNIIDYRNTFIGENVMIDTNYPEDLTIESGVRITYGCSILLHFLNIYTGTYDRGKIHIGKNVHVGCNTTFCKPVTIGDEAIIGACSVVTHDIPAGEVWAGNPARFIRKRPGFGDDASTEASTTTPSQPQP